MISLQLRQLVYKILLNKKKHCVTMVKKFVLWENKSESIFTRVWLLHSSMTCIANSTLMQKIQIRHIPSHI